MREFISYCLQGYAMGLHCFRVNNKRILKILSLLGTGIYLTERGKKRTNCKDTNFRWSLGNTR